MGQGLAASCAITSRLTVMSNAIAGGYGRQRWFQHDDRKDKGFYLHESQICELLLT